jgi:hypothetical protein
VPLAQKYARLEADDLGIVMRSSSSWKSIKVAKPVRKFEVTARG